jgi:hypothetical protein
MYTLVIVAAGGERHGFSRVFTPEPAGGERDLDSAVVRGVTRGAR